MLEAVFSMGEGRTVGSRTPLLNWARRLQIAVPFSDSCKAIQEDYIKFESTEHAILFVTVRDKPCKLPKISLNLLFAALGTNLRVI